ncbi:hypothetical protein EV2_045625 [Malus domestica]
MLAPSRRSLELIPNETARKMAFRKRKKSVYKKANELSKLCDIDVALVVTKLIKRRELGQFSRRHGHKIRLSSIAFSAGTRLPRMLLPPVS